MSTDTLHRLSTLAVQAPAAPDTLCLAAQALREGAGVKETHIVYVPAEEFCWASNPPSERKPIADGGLRRVQRKLPTLGVPLAFDVGAKGRIEGLGPVTEARGRAWLALPFPGRGNFSDMLLVRGDWSGPIPGRMLSLLEACLPSLTVLIGRILDASQSRRQREQLHALSEVARAITQTRDMGAMLTNLANRIAAVTDSEFVSLDVLDEDRHKIVMRCLNESRWSGAPRVEEWSKTIELDGVYRQVLSSARPILLRDLQHDDRVPPERRDYFHRALQVSAALLPLCFQDEVLGFLSISSPRPLAFPPEEVQLLTGLAAQAAAAIKAVQNYEELEASREQLREYAERLRESVEMQHRLARTDALTGIPNRRYVEEFLSAECARSHREGSPLSVALADVDDFKKINDTLGHASGDQALIELSRLAQASCRTMDIVGRYGGDEFVLVLPSARLEDASGIAERLRGRVARKRLRLAGETPARVTLSLGVSQFGSQRRDPDSILQGADEALYRAKALGKNQVCVAEDRVTAA